MTSIKICTFNVRGLNDRKKRRDVFNYLHKKKYDICLLQETHCTKTKENIWENEWGYKAYYSSYASNSRGVVILFNNTFKYDLHNINTDEEGRWILIDCTIGGTHLSLVNIYAPNEDQPIFFEIIKNKLESFSNNSIILGGDFNVVQDYTKDTLNIHNRNNPNAHQKVIDLKMDLDLIDPWRNNNPESKIYTWHNSQNKQSRLDYFLLSSDIIDYVQNTDIKHGYNSDHSIVELQLNFNQQTRGKGLWKMNNSLLKDEIYTASIKQCINEVKNQYKQNNINLPEDDPEKFNINSQLLLEVLKMEIRGKTIAYCTALKRTTNEKENAIEKKIDSLHKQYTESPTVENLEHLNKANDELKLLREKKIDGIIMRAKARWHLEGEKNSKYFCNLEKRHYQEKCIPKLIDNEGLELTEISDILKEQKKFYQDLYTSKTSNVNTESINTFFEHKDTFRILSDGESYSIESPITIEECYKSLKNMSANKSPGSDGFTAEFYLYFWEDLKYIMLNSFRESLRTGKLSDSQRLGVITCLPKPGKDRLYMKNWRPISLLNIDYKILTGALANRIKTFLDPLISKCQKGFVSGRYIGECTRLVSDLIYYLNKTKKAGILLMIDFEKAFDSLEWEFLEKTLQHFNFGNNIRNWIKCCYNNIDSMVINNGHSSERFPIGRGVRQGDPLSPYLFILCTEILARSILNHGDIKGLKIDNSEFILSQLADDTTFFLEPDENSFKTCLKLLEQFSNISGLKINFSKTLAVKINMPINTQYDLGDNRNIKWQNNGKFTLLGIKYDLDQEDFLYPNYENKVNEFKESLNLWNSRYLTVYGKICIVKSIALSKLVHFFSAIPDPQPYFLKDCKTNASNSYGQGEWKK